MFNLSGSEIIVILLLALVILGPEKLPDAMRKAGRAYSELRKMANSFQSEVRSVIDEPMNELRGTADMLRDATDFSGDDKKGGVKKPAPGVRAAQPAATPPGPDGPPAVDEPGEASTPAIAEPVADPGADDDSEADEEDVVTRTLSGDVGPPAPTDDAGPGA